MMTSRPPDTNKKPNLKQSKSLRYPQHNYVNTSQVMYDKEIKLRKLRELQKKSKQAELKSKTVKAIAQHNSFRYFSRHADTETGTNSNHHPYIDLLDDHLLVEIFSSLSTMEKLKMQFVCKRWHKLIWSNENSYKLFKSIEIYEVALRSSHFSSSPTSSKTSKPVVSKQASSSNSFKSTTLSRFFRSNTKKSNDSVNTSSISACSTTPSLNYVLNVDLVLKFLLTKLLNRQTRPLCLCVESIVIRHSTRLTDKSLDLIAQTCPELRHLSLRHCVSLKSNCLSRVVEKCESLKYIDVTGCYNLTSLVVVDPPRLASDEYFYLQFIDLSYCSGVSDQCVQAIAKSCVFVKNLYLRKCRLLTDISLLYIAKYCGNLRELSLSQCGKITDLGIKYLANERIALNNQLLACSMANMSDSQGNEIGIYVFIFLLFHIY